MTSPETAVGPTVVQRWRSARWVLLALVVIVGVATLSTVLTAPRPGGPMDPESTSPEGARALVTILRERGVDVIAADDIAAVERAARPDTLIIVAQTFYLYDDDLLRRLAALPGDRRHHVRREQARLRHARGDARGRGAVRPGRRL